MIRIVLMILVSLVPCASASAETLLERGSYLVNAVMGCDGCHTPRMPSAGLVLEKRLAGGSVR